MTAEVLKAIVDEGSTILLVSGANVSKDVVEGSADSCGVTTWAVSVLFPEAAEVKIDPEGLLVATPVEEANGEFRVAPVANGELDTVPEGLDDAEAESSVVEAVFVSMLWLLERISPV